MGDAWWSANVIGSRLWALSLSDAWWREVTATAPSCSLVVP